eukprot:1197452-Rhodomonas_salina.1
MFLTVNEIPVSASFPDPLPDDFTYFPLVPGGTEQEQMIVMKTEDTLNIAPRPETGIISGMMAYALFRHDIGPRAVTIFWNADDYPREVWFRYREFVRTLQQQPVQLRSVSENMLLYTMQVRAETMERFKLLETHFDIEVNEWDLHEFKFDPYSVVWGNTFIDNIENNLCFIVDLP